VNGGPKVSAPAALAGWPSSSTVASVTLRLLAVDASLPLTDRLCSLSSGTAAASTSSQARVSRSLVPARLKVPAVLPAASTVASACTAISPGKVAFRRGTAIAPLRISSAIARSRIVPLAKGGLGDVESEIDVELRRKRRQAGHRRGRFRRRLRDRRRLRQERAGLGQQGQPLVEIDLAQGQLAAQRRLLALRQRQRAGRRIAAQRRLEVIERNLRRRTSMPPSNAKLPTSDASNAGGGSPVARTTAAMKSVSPPVETARWPLIVASGAIALTRPSKVRRPLCTFSSSLASCAPSSRGA
jgi:hypothetical protein